ncbi:MAG TPA: hypothetical protein VF532_07135 [Candidatus Angelobacter sp.]
MARVVTEADLKSLAEFHDEHGHAVSFYFRPGDGSERDGALMNLRVRNLISNHFLCGEKSHGLLRDLDAILELSEAKTEQPGQVKVVFACHDQGIWCEFTVPSSARIVRLEAGKKFDVSPLLRLLHPGNGLAANIA